MFRKFPIKIFEYFRKILGLPTNFNSSIFTKKFAKTKAFRL